MEVKKTPEKSVTQEMVKKVHLTLADLTTGEEVLGYLKNTEPVFINEVNRFIQTEISRMHFQFTEQQAVYIGAVAGAAYVAGYLIAREAFHELFDGLIDCKSVIKEALTPEEIEKVIDQKIDKGMSYKQISRVIRGMIEKNTKKISYKNPDKKTMSKEKGKKLDLGDLS
jgi:hypothetical protein